MASVPQSSPTTPAPVTDTEALIIGAGFSGLYQLHSLRDRLGLSVQVLEMADGVGGTWYWNRYPGARCDSESHSYMYYFSDALLKEWQWSERYPGQAEILRYLNFVADRLDLKRSVRFNTRVTGARYDEAANRWLVSTESGEQYRTRYLITAVGCLSSANIPAIPGLADFTGRWYHTGQWPHEGVDFSGKRVGLVGTGSTGIQATPVIAEAAAHLTVFQRTPNYSVPAHNAPLSEGFKRYVADNSDRIRQVMHATPNGHPFIIAQRSAHDPSEPERQALYESAWSIGGLRFRSVFRDLLVDKAANDTASSFLKNKIREIVKDPATAEKLADIDHPFAAKRPPIDTGYFETFNRPNVTLIDVRADPIERITATGIQTGKAHHELDVIVFATGFDALTGPLKKLNLVGRGGVSLNALWEAGPRSYLGLQVSGFPNLFTLTGPGSPSVLVNMPVAIEQHVDWVTDCIAHLRKEGIARMEPRPEAMEAWSQQVQAAAEATLLSKVPHSWYLGANVPGKPRVFMPYAGGMPRYRQICQEVAQRGYEGFAFSR
jgi:cation diffusion facilitator CzcD-associated flavoprotein CzcO